MGVAPEPRYIYLKEIIARIVLTVHSPSHFSESSMTKVVVFLPGETDKMGGRKGDRTEFTTKKGKKLCPQVVFAPDGTKKGKAKGGGVRKRRENFSRR